MSPEIDQVARIANLIQTGGVVTILVLILIGGYRRWWVWGYQLVDAEARATKRETDLQHEVGEWKTLALRNQSMAARTIDMHEKLTQEVREAP